MNGIKEWTSAAEAPRATGPAASTAQAQGQGPAAQGETQEEAAREVARAYAYSGWGTPPWAVKELLRALDDRFEWHCAGRRLEGCCTSKGGKR